MTEGFSGKVRLDVKAVTSTFVLDTLCQGFPTWRRERSLKYVISWVHLYQWGNAIVVRGDADTKRLGTPALGLCS
jgi:hypothetical protein